MGLPTSIETLLTGNVVEGARIEFKTSWMPEASLKTICAFANDIDNWGGGYIVLGVKEKNGRPVLPFDDRVNHQAEMTDLNINLIRQYLSAVGSGMVKDLDSRPLEKICEDMGICNTMPEYRKPKNVGLMFFSDEPERFFPYAQIDVVAFPKGLGGDEIDEQTFRGPLDQQLRDALRYISNNYVQRKIIKYPDRAEADHIYNYPYAALEEALANAVYHKAYDVREPIEVRIEDDKIEIVSYPGPVYSVTREQLKDYRVSNRRYRNRRIGEFLKELRLTEGRNTGFKKILDAIKRNGSPLPEFETDKEHSYFISRIFVHPDFISGMEEDKRIDETGGINDGRNPEKVKNEVINDGIRLKLSYISEYKREKIKELLQIIKGNPCVEIDSIATQLDVSRSTAERYLAELRRMEIIKREGSNKSGKWRIL